MRDWQLNSKPIDKRLVTALEKALSGLTSDKTLRQAQLYQMLQTLNAESNMGKDTAKQLSGPWGLDNWKTLNTHIKNSPRITGLAKQLQIQGPLTEQGLQDPVVAAPYAVLQYLNTKGKSFSDLNALERYGDNLYVEGFMPKVDARHNPWKNFRRAEEGWSQTID